MRKWTLGFIIIIIFSWTWVSDCYATQLDRVYEDYPPFPGQGSVLVWQYTSDGAIHCEVFQTDENYNNYWVASSIGDSPSPRGNVISHRQYKLMDYPGVNAYWSAWTSYNTNSVYGFWKSGMTPIFNSCPIKNSANETIILREPMEWSSAAPDDMTAYIHNVASIVFDETKFTTLEKQYEQAMNMQFYIHLEDMQAAPDVTYIDALADLKMHNKGEGTVFIHVAKIGTDIVVSVELSEYAGIYCPLGSAMGILDENITTLNEFTDDAILQFLSDLYQRFKLYIQSNDTYNGYSYNTSGEYVDGVELLYDGMYASTDSFDGYMSQRTYQYIPGEDDVVIVINDDSLQTGVSVVVTNNWDRVRQWLYELFIPDDTLLVDIKNTLDAKMPVFPKIKAELDKIILAQYNNDYQNNVFKIDIVPHEMLENLDIVPLSVRSDMDPAWTVNVVDGNKFINYVETARDIQMYALYLFLLMYFFNRLKGVFDK